MGICRGEQALNVFFGGTVPCGSTYDNRRNFGDTVAHCRNLIKGDRLKGFLMAPWYYRTQEDKRGKIMESLDVMAAAIKCKTA